MPEMLPVTRVQFFKKPILIPNKSEELKRPVYEEYDYIKIQVAGERDYFEGPVNEQHRAEFPNEWQAYQCGAQMTVSGTPLEEWPQMRPGIVNQLKALEVFTVEALAGLSDVQLQKIPNGSKLRQDAREYLTRASDAASSAELVALREKSAAQEAQLTQQAEQLAKSVELLEKMSARVEELEKSAKKPGPKPK